MRLSRLCLSAAVVLMVGCASASSEAVTNAPFFKYDFTTVDNSFWYVSNGWVDGDYQACEWMANHIVPSGGDIEILLSNKSMPAGAVRPVGCGEIRTREQPGYGFYEARIRTTAGSGLNTAFFTYTGPANNTAWDEIDMEFLGKDPTSVQLNVYTNGKNPGGKLIPLGFDSSKGYHQYGFDWEPTKIKWFADGKEIFETPDGAAIPTHPGALFFSLWAGGAQENAWLGPFAYKSLQAAYLGYIAYTPPATKCAVQGMLSCTTTKTTK